MDGIAYLISYTSSGKDEIGQELPPVTEKREIYCTRKSIKQSEFYQASQIGMKPEFVIETSMFDYSGEEIIEVDNVLYKIYRTFKREDEIIELYCIQKSGV
jgi:phage head-tail adaptor, putative, SPP1 family